MAKMQGSKLVEADFLKKDVSSAVFETVGTLVARTCCHENQLLGSHKHRRNGDNNQVAGNCVSMFFSMSSLFNSSSPANWIQQHYQTPNPLAPFCWCFFPPCPTKKVCWSKAGGVAPNRFLLWRVFCSKPSSKSLAPGSLPLATSWYLECLVETSAFNYIIQLLMTPSS